MPAPRSGTVDGNGQAHHLEDTMPVSTRPRRTHPNTAPAYYPSRPAHAAEQAEDIFHELHADGRNALCVVCDSQYGWRDYGSA
jgi:hypothetical protein